MMIATAELKSCRLHYEMPFFRSSHSQRIDLPLVRLTTGSNTTPVTGRCCSSASRTCWTIARASGPGAMSQEINDDEAIDASGKVPAPPPPIKHVRMRCSRRGWSGTRSSTRTRSQCAGSRSISRPCPTRPPRPPVHAVGGPEEKRFRSHRVTAQLKSFLRLRFRLRKPRRR